MQSGSRNVDEKLLLTESESEIFLVVKEVYKISVFVVCFNK